MGRHVTQIMHNGKQAIFLDGSGLSDDEGMAAWEDMNQDLLKEWSGSLIMIQAKDVTMATATVNKAKEAASATEAQGIEAGLSAVVGLTGLQKAVAQLFGRGAHFLDTVDQAKEYLAKADNKRQKR